MAAPGERADDEGADESGAADHEYAHKETSCLITLIALPPSPVRTGEGFGGKVARNRSS